MVLSSTEAFLCCREAGEKEKGSTRGAMGRENREERLPPFPSSHRFSRAFYFLIFATFVWKPSGRLCRGERCSGMVVWCSRVEPKVPGSSPTQYPFFPFFVLLFFINIYLNNCYLSAINSKKSIVFPPEEGEYTAVILNIWINNLNFYHFLQFTVGKPELITI